MKNAKKSLFVSVLSLVLCVAMLLGTTYAWFTDSVSSGVNTIQAGNLDIELEYLNDTTWAPVTTGTKLFDNNALWEPGHTEVAYLRLSNVGSLALKYNIAINVAGEVGGTNIDGNAFKLSDYIKMGVVEDWNGTAYANRDEARAAVTDADSIITYSKSGNMEANESSALTFAIVTFMPETVGNEANHKTGTTPPSIELGVDVVATQWTKEKDSFDEKYDITTPWLGGVAEAVPVDENVYLVSNGEELAKIAAMVNGGNDLDGKTVKLVKDIDLNNVKWTPIGSDKAFNGDFDGQNHTILNLKASGDQKVGLFGYLYNYGTIKNLTVKNAEVSGVAYVGVIGGSVYGDISNCHVENATVTAVKNAAGKDGAKAGAIAGYLREGSSMKITGCSAKTVTINGIRDLGGIVGSIYGDNTVTGNTCEAVTINQSDITGYNDGDTSTLGAIYGRKIEGDYTGGTFQDNTSSGVTIRKAPEVIVISGEQTATQAVAAAIATAEPGDSFILPTTTKPIKLPNIPDGITGVTIKGDGTTTIDASGSGQVAKINGATLEDVVIDLGSNSNYHGFQHSDAKFKNCTIKGLLCSYNNGGEQVFENCTFIQENEEYNMWAYGDVTYKNCTFKSYGKFVNVYQEGDAHFDVNFDGCRFINMRNVANKAAVNVKDTSTNSVGVVTKLDIKVTIKNCTYEGEAPVTKNTDALKVYNPVVQLDDIKEGASKIVIIQDGTTLWPAN